MNIFTDHLVFCAKDGLDMTLLMEEILHQLTSKYHNIYRYTSEVVSRISSINSSFASHGATGDTLFGKSGQYLNSNTTCQTFSQISEGSSCVNERFAMQPFWLLFFAGSLCRLPASMIFSGGCSWACEVSSHIISKSRNSQKAISDFSENGHCKP